MGGIPSTIPEVGFFIRGVGSEYSGGGNSEGKVGESFTRVEDPKP